MRKRVQIALAVLLVAIAGVIAWQVLSLREPINQRKRTNFEVVGVLTAKDVTGIKRLVRREKWRGLFSDHSLSGIRQLPTDIKSRFSRHLVRVARAPDGVVSADVESDKDPGSWWRFEVEQGLNGWRVLRVTRTIIMQQITPAIINYPITATNWLPSNTPFK